jgi:uncharacterized membrane protein
MKIWPFRSRTVWIMPLVFLVVVLIEDVVTYEVRHHVRDLYLRAAIVMGLNAFAFVLVAGWLAPWLRDLLARARKGSKRTGGEVGLWVFYALAYGAIFYAYLVVERHGAGGLLPGSLR